MAKISDARKNYKPRTLTVTVCLDSEVALQRDELLRQLTEVRKAKPASSGRLTQKGPDSKIVSQLTELEDKEREHMHVLRFTKLDGLEWANIAATHPAREGSAEDQALGYNSHAVALEAGSQSVVEIVDGQDDPQSVDAEDWATILEVGSGWDIDNIVTTVMALNVMNGARTVARLKKD